MSAKTLVGLVLCLIAFDSAVYGLAYLGVIWTGVGIGSAVAVILGTLVGFLLLMVIGFGHQLRTDVRRLEEEISEVRSETAEVTSALSQHGHTSEMRRREFEGPL